MSKTDNIFEFLKEEGYLPKFDDDDDLFFKQESKTVYVICPESDIEYISLYCFFHTGDTFNNLDQVYQVVNEINNRFKVVKLSVVSTENLSDKPDLSTVRIIFSVEGFYNNISEFKDNFIRILSVLNSSIKACLQSAEELISSNESSSGIGSTLSMSVPEIEGDSQRHRN